MPQHKAVAAGNAIHPERDLECTFREVPAGHLPL
jgi:hypothetical protein